MRHKDNLISSRVSIAPLTNRAVLTRVTNNITLADIIMALGIRQDNTVRRTRMVLLLVNLHVHVQYHGCQPTLVNTNKLKVMQGHSHVRTLRRNEVIQLDRVRPRSEARPGYDDTILTNDRYNDAISNHLNTNNIVSGDTDDTYDSIIRVGANRRVAIYHYLNV